MDKKKFRVYTDMVADLFHWGHVNLLKRAKEISKQKSNSNQEGILVVGIHDDQDVAKYKRIPIMNLDERVKVVKACRYVDEVVEKAPLEVTPEFIERNNIDLVVHSHREEENEKYNFMYRYAKQLNKFKRIEYTENISTTDIINRLKLHQT